MENNDREKGFAPRPKNLLKYPFFRRAPLRVFLAKKGKQGRKVIFKGGTGLKIEIFALCDAAAEYAGKLCLLGVFDTISAREFPFIHPHCSIALRIRFDRIEEGGHRLRISIVDEDGNPIVPIIEGNININFPPNLFSVCGNTVLDLSGLRFPKPGRYRIDLAVDNRLESSLPLTVQSAGAKHGSE